MVNIQEIDAYMNESIRPYLKSHYGDVHIVGLEDGVLHIKLVGQCTGCPSAQYTVEDVIEKDVCERFPEVKKVELMTEVSQELLDFAKKLMSHEDK